MIIMVMEKIDYKICNHNAKFVMSKIMGIGRHKRRGRRNVKREIKMEEGETGKKKKIISENST